MMAMTRLPAIIMGAHHDAQEHENDILHLGDVVGEARDHCPSQFVDVGEEHLHGVEARRSAPKLWEARKKVQPTPPTMPTKAADHPEAGLEDGQVG